MIEQRDILACRYAVEIEFDVSFRYRSGWSVLLLLGDRAKVEDDSLRHEPVLFDRMLAFKVGMMSEERQESDARQFPA